jgi:transposase
VSCPKDLNAKGYAKILKENMPNSCTFIMDDGWPVHKAKEPREVLEDKQVQDLFQPPWSSDLQPAEQVLAALSNETYTGNKQYKDVNALKKGIKAAFDRMKSGQTESKYTDKDLFRKLAAGMPGRMLECVTAKGNHIRLR